MIPDPAVPVHHVVDKFNDSLKIEFDPFEGGGEYLIEINDATSNDEPTTAVVALTPAQFRVLVLAAGTYEQAREAGQ